MIFPILNRFFHWMIIGIISPVLVLMISSKGADLTQVGLIMAVLSAGVVIFELPSGVLSDRLGRKRIYLVSLAAFFVSFVVLLLFDGVLALSLAFLLFGLARAFASGSVESDFIDNFLDKNGPDKLDGLFTGMSVAETLGLALGALVGGVLPTLTHSLFPTVNEFSGNLVAQMVIVVGLFVSTALFHKRHKASEATSVPDFLAGSWRIVRGNKTIRILLVGSFVWGFCFFALETYWQPQLKGLLGAGASTEVFGYLNSGYFVTAVVGSLVAMPVFRLLRLSDRRAILVFRILLGVGLVAIGMQSSAVAFGVLYLLIMGFNGMVSIPERTMFNREVPEDSRSSFLSFASLVLQLGGIVGSLAFSLIVGVSGLTVVFAVSGAAFAVSGLLYGLLPKDKAGTGESYPLADSSES
jgi:DHA1 family quinolone resistance protein-like MFS transporter